MKFILKSDWTFRIFVDIFKFKNKFYFFINIIFLFLFIVIISNDHYKYIYYKLIKLNYYINEKENI